MCHIDDRTIGGEFRNLIRAPFLTEPITFREPACTVCGAIYFRRSPPRCVPLHPNFEETAEMLLRALGFSIHEKILLCSLAVIGIACALFVGRVGLAKVSEHRLQDYSEDVMRHAVDVAQSSISALRSVDGVNELGCSDANLGEMRLLLFRTEYLSDIGRTDNGYLQCSAVWGRFSPPLKLPPVQRRQANGDELWADVQSVVDRRLTVDMAAHGSAIVFTSPTAFKSYEKPEASLSALVFTKDGGHLFRSFGDTTELAKWSSERQPWVQLGPRLVTSNCEENLDICVVAAMSGVSILRQPAWVIVAVSCMGAGLLCGIGLIVLLDRKASSSLPNQIRRSVAAGRLSVVYQPLVLIRDKSMVGAEALARLTDEQGAAIAPDVFIGIAEEIGLIAEITRIVVRRSLEDLQKRLIGADDFYVSINVSVSDVIDPTFCRYLDDQTEQFGIPRQRVVLELTERSTADHGQLREAVIALRRSGYGFLVDDFGTGYSNLSYLATLPISGIKVDRVFTQAIGKEAVSSALVEKICSIADALGVNLIIEGIETAEQASYVLDLNANAIGQGWLFGRPSSPALL